MPTCVKGLTTGPDVPKMTRTSSRQCGISCTARRDSARRLASGV